MRVEEEKNNLERRIIEKRRSQKERRRGLTRRASDARSRFFEFIKSHASGKSKSPYFRISRIGSDVFFDADFESPHMT